jgi:hypothetical protein
LSKASEYTKHRFLDEAGDLTFYGKGKREIVGTEGVSNTFILGMVKFKTPLSVIREEIIRLRQSVSTDGYYKDIPSIQKKIRKGAEEGRGYYFHATDDLPEIRKTFYDFINTLDCSFEAVVARKELDRFTSQHREDESEFYADTLSHLLKNKLKSTDELILHIAERGKTTRNSTLVSAYTKAKDRYSRSNPFDETVTDIKLNVQNHFTEPLLDISDYFCWSIQRVFERGEMRYYHFLQDKISLVIDIYDKQKYQNSKNYYRRGNVLTSENCLAKK